MPANSYITLALVICVIIVWIWFNYGGGRKP